MAQAVEALTKAGKTEELKLAATEVFDDAHKFVDVRFRCWAMRSAMELRCYCFRVP